MKYYLLTLPELRDKSKNIARTLLWEDVEPYILEAQNLDIKPKITDELLIELLSYLDLDKQDDEIFNILLDGGIYTVKDRRYSLSGLKASLSYYTYARLVNNLNYDLNRFGYSEKNDQYTDKTEIIQRKTMRLDATSTADTYMAECLVFIKANTDKFKMFENKNIRMRNNIRMRVIGD